MAFLLLLLTFTLSTPLSLLTASPTTTTTPTTQLESALTTMRTNSYTLFSNSISLSDLTFDIITMAGGLTLLAPPNGAIYTLDISSPTSSTYLNSLRHHIIPRRLTFSDLRLLSLSPHPFLPTLIPHHFLHVKLSSPNVVTVDGVRVRDRDLFLGSHLVVHGIDGVLPSSHHHGEGGFFDGLSSVDGDQFPPEYSNVVGGGSPMQATVEDWSSQEVPSPSPYGEVEEQEEYSLSPGPGGVGLDWEWEELPRKYYKKHVVEEQEDVQEEGQDGHDQEVNSFHL